MCIERLTVTTGPLSGSHRVGCYTNRLADGLANYVFSLPLGFHLFEARPDVVTSIVFEDANGYARHVMFVFKFYSFLIFNNMRGTLSPHPTKKKTIQMKFYILCSLVRSMSVYHPRVLR